MVVILLALTYSVMRAQVKIYNEIFLGRYAKRINSKDSETQLPAIDTSVYIY